jgi:hypothetical protein
MSAYYFGNLTADRVVFSTGRDITLVPKQEGPPVNYLIYPYDEVDGKPTPQPDIERLNKITSLDLSFRKRAAGYRGWPFVRAPIRRLWKPVEPVPCSGISRL